MRIIETSRFGNEQKKFKTIDERPKPTLIKRNKTNKENRKDEFSSFTDDNINKIIEGDKLNETLSLSNITKDQPSYYYGDNK